MDSFIAKQLGLTNTENKANDDSELWARLSQSRNGSMIKDFCECKYQDYSINRDKAVGEVIFRLAYVCNFDESQVERVFKTTKLSKQINENENLRGFIHDVINQAREHIKDLEQEFSKEPGKSGSQTQSQGVGVSPSQNEPQQDLESKPIEFHSDAEYLDSVFEADIKNFKKYSGRKTGFANLDGKLILYPCLCTFGAISSLGKTTFSLQLADNLASMGEHVLYFAFEQTRFELVSKSLARLCQPEDSLISSYPSAIDIRNGRITTPKLREAMQKFKAISQHKQIIECDFTMSVSKVVETVEAYINQTGVRPVVVVDYLQVISSDNSKLTNTKDIVDDNIKALKLLQMRHELLMFVVSSINRENYLTTIDFQSFKESGSIEFTCDIVIGMQLAVMNTNLFESDAKTTIKRKAVKSAKKENPRHIELCILKNRYGVSSESFFFQYYPKFDLFIPEDKASAISAVKSLVETELAKDKKQAK